MIRGPWIFSGCLLTYFIHNKSVCRTGTEDTFTNSDISVTVEPLTQDNLVKDMDDEEESSEEDESDEDDDDVEEKEEEMNETEPKTDEETLVEKLTRLQEELLTKAASLERKYTSTNPRYFLKYAPIREDIWFYPVSRLWGESTFFVSPCKFETSWEWRFCWLG